MKHAVTSLGRASTGRQRPASPEVCVEQSARGLNDKFYCSTTLHYDLSLSSYTYRQQPLSLCMDLLADQ